LRHDVVITGLGAVSPLGVGVPAYAAGLRAGRSGIRPLGFADDRIKSSASAQCPDFDPTSVLTPADLTRVPKLIPMALAAAREAAAQARLPIAEALGRDASRAVGLVLGTGGGGIDFTLSQADAGHHGRRPSLWTITNATHGNLAGELSIALGFRGPSLCVSTGCASSSDAFGMALEVLRGDRAGAPDTILVVGADAHVRWETLLGMELLRVISTRDFRADPAAAPTASRPFDKSRDGFILGEGAWAVVLDRLPAARRREARPIARAAGYAATCDAFHRVRPDPDMVESARAMTLAAQDAGLHLEEIQTVHYHGTSTQLNDALETVAVKLAFGDHAPRLAGHSVKGAIGHPQGACGMAALVATLAGLTSADTPAGVPPAPFIPPTINLHTPDPACDLDYTPNTAAPTQATTALINCLAFGAKNTAIVVQTLP